MFLFLFLFFYVMYVFLSSRAILPLPLAPHRPFHFGWVFVGFGAVYSCSMACVSVCQCMLCNVRYALCIRCYSVIRRFVAINIIILSSSSFCCVFFECNFSFSSHCSPNTIILPTILLTELICIILLLSTIGTKEKLQEKTTTTRRRRRSSLFPIAMPFRSLPSHNFTTKTVEIFKIVCNWLHPCITISSNNS